MKLLNKYLSLSDAENMAERLEKKGIVTHISSKRSHSIAMHNTGAIHVGLWIILEHQYEDALAFQNNPKHKITTGISSEEIADLKEQSSVATFNSFNKFIVFTLSGIVVILLFVYLASIYFAKT